MTLHGLVVPINGAGKIGKRSATAARGGNDPTQNFSRSITQFLAERPNHLHPWASGFPAAKPAPAFRDYANRAPNPALTKATTAHHPKTTPMQVACLTRVMHEYPMPVRMSVQMLKASIEVQIE